MISTALMKFLVIFYVGILVVCLWEREWPKAMYWLGAAILNVAIIWGMGK